MLTPDVHKLTIAALDPLHTRTSNVKQSVARI